MASIYVARLKNARRMFNDIKRYLRAGYIIFDENNNRVKSVTYAKYGYSEDGKKHIEVLINNTFIYMISDPQMANGMELTVKEFNGQFKDWTIVHPRHFVKL